MYVKLPFAFIATVPWAAGVTTAAESDGPSMSVSLASTPGALTTSGASSAVPYESATATGASFTGLTVKVTVAAAELVSPSLAV